MNQIIVQIAVTDDIAHPSTVDFQFHRRAIPERFRGSQARTSTSVPAFAPLEGDHLVSLPQFADQVGLGVLVDHREAPTLGFLLGGEPYFAGQHDRLGELHVDGVRVG